MAKATAVLEDKSPTFMAIELPVFTHVRVKLVGTAPLLTHAGGDGLAELLLNQQKEKALGKKKKDRAPQNPFEEFKKGFYPLMSGKEFPTVELKVGESWPYLANTFTMLNRAFQCSLVEAMLVYGGFKTDARRWIRPVGPQYIPIKYDKVVLRQDVVRMADKTPSPRFRPEFHNWSLEVEIAYRKNSMPDPKSFWSLAIDAGNCVGIGDGRSIGLGRFDPVGIETKEIRNEGI